MRDELHALVLRDWDPDLVMRRLERQQRHRALVGNWVSQARPVEPDAVWFAEPPVNTFDATRRPRTQRGRRRDTNSKAQGSP